MHHYDILLLDINLPDGSGLDLCREVVQQNDLQNETRIIFMSGLVSASDEVKGLELGAADYIRKPINGALLLARVRLQTQMLRRNELLANLVRIDHLTEIPNRRAFDAQLANEWDRATRENTNLAVAMVDIDHFKNYNDTYGHPAGDRCLQAVAEVLQKTFQRSSDFVARYGGEEFAVILYGTDYVTACDLFHCAEAELRALAIEHRSSPTQPYVTFSAGVCCTMPEWSTTAEALALADQQLYLAKGMGRAQVCTMEVNPKKIQ